MKLNTLSLVVVTSAAIALTGCVSPNGQANNTGTGALAGTVAGAGLGAIASHGSAGGALIGAAAGAIVGGIAGNIADQRQAAELQQQAPQTYTRVQQGQPLSISDVKALAQAGVSDDTIIAQIQSSGSVFHLAAADIIYLHNSNVSEKVINYMINTPSTNPGGMDASAAPPATTYVQAPPAVDPADPVVVMPGPGYAWVGGDWFWRGGRWVWVGGHWGYPPRPGVIWVGGYWGRGPHGYYRVRGHWR